MKIIFFGTSEFGAIILEKLVRANLSPVLVVTTPDKPVGRKQVLTPSPVKALILKHETWNLKLLQPETFDSRFTLHVSSFRPDLFIVGSYGKILPKEILDIPQYGALNVHPSLLPKYRGASPIQTVILHGEDETGVTIMLMDEKMDHGPIVANSKFEIRNSKFTYPELHSKLAEIGANLLIETIPLWIEGKIKPIPQDESKATYTTILKKEDGRIDWNKETGYIERQVRALNPWPGTFTAFKIKNQNPKSKNTDQSSKILKILETSAARGAQKGNVRETLTTADGKLAVYTGNGILVVEKVQLEGGKPMNSREFLLGHREVVGIVLSGILSET